MSEAGNGKRETGNVVLACAGLRKSYWQGKTEVPVLAASIWPFPPASRWR
jgi:hypothetical protein